MSRTAPAIGQSVKAPRHACWLSQQAAEKALKAALVLEAGRMSPSRTRLGRPSQSILPKAVGL